MHDCPICGEACYCDMEDLPMPAPSYCRHKTRCENEEAIREEYDGPIDDTDKQKGTT
jgi:hypothetical protein